MRIISGTAAGTILKVPKGFDVRPTPDLVRQAIFNSLGGRVIETRVVEFFAGTGALSLECLSRGAKHALCVELSSRHAQYIRENLSAARLDPSVIDIRVQDALVSINQLAQASAQFDIILADPPYGPKNVGRRSDSFAQRLLDNVSLPKICAPGGLFILGHTKRDTLSFPAWWTQAKTLKHGDTMIEFLEPSGV